MLNQQLKTDSTQSDITEPIDVENENTSKLQAVDLAERDKLKEVIDELREDDE